MTICVYLLLFIFSCSQIIASEKLDTKQFESALKATPYAEIHESDCLITLYDNGEKQSYCSGTYMKDQKSNRTFILMTAHLAKTITLQSNQRITVTFDGTTEYQLEAYTPLKKITPLQRLDNIRSNRPDLAVGFIPAYNGSINPAQFPPIKYDESMRNYLLSKAEDDLSGVVFNFLSYASEEQIIKQYQAIKPRLMKEEECNIAGYGRLIDPMSTKDVLILSPNYKRVKTLFTLKISPISSGSKEILTGICLRSTYQRPGSKDATPFESLLRPGFSGASLRNKEGYVTGVASNVEVDPINKIFAEQNPYKAKFFNTAHHLIDQYSSPIYYSLPVFCAGLATTCVLGNNCLGYMSFATTVVGSYVASYIPYANSRWNDLKLPGAQSYFFATAEWEEDIGSTVATYWNK